MSKYNSNHNNNNKTPCKILHLILNKLNNNLLHNKKKLKSPITLYLADLYHIIKLEYRNYFLKVWM